jgi:hypothetical protein
MLAQAHVLFSGKYDPQERRHVRKSGSRIVVWIGAEDAISEQEVTRQEAFLIWIYKPRENQVRPNKGATPTDLTHQIKNGIDHELSKIITADK